MEILENYLGKVKAGIEKKSQLKKSKKEKDFTSFSMELWLFQKFISTENLLEVGIMVTTLSI